MGRSQAARAGRNDDEGGGLCGMCFGGGGSQNTGVVPGDNDDDY